MFRIDEIMTATRFVRSFQEVANYLSRTSATILITQKNGAISYQIHFKTETSKGTTRWSRIKRVD